MTDENKIQLFLQALFRPGETINLRLIGDGPPINEFIEFSDDAGKQTASIIRRHQPKYNIYFGAHPRTKAFETRTIERVSSAFVDLDSKDFPSYPAYQEHMTDLIGKLHRLNLDPSIVVDSGNGTHLYWVMKSQAQWSLGLDEAGNQSCPDWKELQKALIHFCRADKSLHDLPRILRMPETLNVKDPKNQKLCRLSQIDPDKTYSRKDFKFVVDTYRDHKKELENQEKAAIVDFHKKQQRAPEKDDLRNILIEVLAQTDGVCDEYDDFLRIAMAFKSAGASYEEIDPIFRRSRGYDLEKNRKIYAKLRTKKIKLGTAYHYAKRLNPRLLEEKIRGGKRDRPGQTATPDGQSEKTGQERPARKEIEIEGGKLPWICDQAEEVLAKGGKVYQRNGFLVKIVFTGSTSVRRDDATPNPVIRIIETNDLVDILTRSASFYRYDPRKNDQKYVDCPKGVAETILARGQWKVPELAGVVSAPTMRPNGSILQKAGYDPGTGLMLVGKKFPEISDKPSREDALKAISTIKAILADIPFKAQTDKSVAVSAILTAIVRKSLETAPLFVFSAPKRGSGKTLLTDVVAMIATGKRSAKISQSQDEGEDQKTLLAVLMEGDEVVCIDNVEKPLEGDALCTIISEPEWSARILGVTRLGKVSTNATWTTTGNNIRIKGDLASRSIICRLDPNCEHPEERVFDEHLRKIVLRKRAELIHAALTVLRAYHCAGRPKPKIKEFARFEEWSSLVRSAIVWLGEPDPCGSRKRIEEDDPDREQLAEILEALYDCFQGEPATVAAMKTVIESGSEYETGKRERLKNALLSICDKNEIKDRMVGFYFRSKAERIENCLQLKRGKKSMHGTQWAVVPVIDSKMIEQAREMIAAGDRSEGDVEDEISVPACLSKIFWQKVLSCK